MYMGLGGCVREQSPNATTLQPMQRGKGTERTRVVGGDVCSNTVILEHAQQCRLASIVKTQEQQLA